MAGRVKVLRHGGEGLREIVPGQFFFRHVHGAGMTMALYRFQRGDQGPLPIAANRHEEEVSVVISGRVRLVIEGEEVVLGPGDAILIPPFAEHTGEFLTDEVVLVSAFAPRREELGPEEATGPMRFSFVGEGGKQGRSD